MVNPSPKKIAPGDVRIPPEVYFYGTCVVDLAHPSAGLSAMKLLRSAGLKVIFPAGQTCCSQPAFNSGYREEARKVAEAQLNLFPRPLPVVVPSASCAEMFKEHYPTLFKGTPNERKAAELASRVREWGEFFSGEVAPNLRDGGAKIKVYCHTSCHGKKGRPAMLDLLNRLDFVEIVETPHTTECCGFGGAFSVKHADLSGHVAMRKTEEILASGAEVLVSGECGCMLNIEGMLRKKGSAIPCSHIADFILERTHA